MQALEKINRHTAFDRLDATIEEFRSKMYATQVPRCGLYDVNRRGGPDG
jgi:hypothetical protein